MGPKAHRIEGDKARARLHPLLRRQLRAAGRASGQPDLDALLELVSCTYDAHEPLRPGAAPPSRPAPADPKPVRAVRPRGERWILVAAEDAATRQALKGLLAEREAELAFAANGADAVQAAVSQDFDLVLMDMQLPILDGPSATRALRSLDGLRASVPIVALIAEPDQARLCAAAGMDGHVAKPLRAEALFAAMEQVLGRASAA